MVKKIDCRIKEFPTVKLFSTGFYALGFLLLASLNCKIFSQLILLVSPIHFNNLLLNLYNRCKGRVGERKREKEREREREHIVLT